MTSTVSSFVLPEIIDSNLTREELITLLFPKLPESVAALIVTFLEVPKHAKSFRIGNEHWVRIDSINFQRLVAYLQISYPWAQNNRALHKVLFKLCLKHLRFCVAFTCVCFFFWNDIAHKYKFLKKKEEDTYLEGLELYGRFGSNKLDVNDTNIQKLSAKELGFLKEIVTHIENRAQKKTAKDLITNYGSYMLYNEFGMDIKDILSGNIKSTDDFTKEWELYGDKIELLSHNIGDSEMEIWRKCNEKILHFKNVCYPKSYLICIL
ncbi:hypothetical protein RFI_16266 [Reticulomyxa filosa]|uniref:Uncharacterized protein n=1 Tax=Reticulomyxa filosa TaxID=46433 RepID=X6N4L2_RETFI|nr:hypothetical protein RFI_16266 [Reticulomyxa filosa]|eukprot:ETO20936.1 hypothetical protein RFI_16266 [Reticulomyxa filosa]